MATKAMEPTMKMIKDFFNALFTPPNVIDDVTQRTHKATAEVMHCNVSIEKARYSRHMAICELQALEAWNHQRDVKEKML
jgi:hypothetical protein